MPENARRGTCKHWAGDADWCSIAHACDCLRVSRDDLWAMLQTDEVRHRFTGRGYTLMVYVLDLQAQGLIPEPVEQRMRHALAEQDALIAETARLDVEDLLRSALG